jgi:hypothetical protein
VIGSEVSVADAILERMGEELERVMNGISTADLRSEIDGM